MIAAEIQFSLYLLARQEQNSPLNNTAYTHTRVAANSFSLLPAN
jgi:hypothetical protein